MKKFTQMDILLIDTDYMDYKDGCAALHKIHIIRVK